VTDGVPAGVPPEEAEAARDTLGGAVDAGDQLRDPLAAELLDAAREAFTQALQITAVTSAALVTVLAVVALIVLRRVPSGSALEEPPDLEPDGAIA
jgi:DHA2 family multidrug resistance protein-like MFS transporter